MPRSNKIFENIFLKKIIFENLWMYFEIFLEYFKSSSTEIETYA